MAGVMTVPPPIDDLQGWLVALTQPTALTELAALAVCVALAWGLAWLARRAVGRAGSQFDLVWTHGSSTA